MKREERGETTWQRNDKKGSKGEEGGSKRERTVLDNEVLIYFLQ